MSDDFAAYEMASAATLAEQSASLPMEPDRPNFDWDVIFSHLESRLGMMRNIRYPKWAYWSQLAEYQLPERYRWLVTANNWSRMGPVNQAIVDTTPTWSLEVCSSGMVDGLMPTTRRWFKVKIALADIEPDQEGQEWLESTESRAYVVLAQSNFYDVMSQAAQDEVAFGTAPVIMYEDYDDVIRCYGPCAGEYYLSASSRLSIDTMYREYTMTVSQIVEMFTLKACPEQVRKLWEAGGASLENEMVVAHAIEPNFPLDGRGRTKGSKIDVIKGRFPFREVYWLKGTKTSGPLSKRGFHHKPFAVFRWAKVGNDPYGVRCPGMVALGDNKQLQLETRRKAEGIEKQVRPPMGADPALKNEPSSILPGNITYMDTANGKKGFWPLFEVKPDLNAMVADLKEIQGRIERSYLVDVFMAITQMEGVQPRNNLEIAKREQEKMQRLGPVIGLWKTEGAQPLLQRLLEIMERRKLLKPLPQSLQGVPLKFDIIDMVTLAQLGTETAAMEETFRVGGELSLAAKNAGVPDPLRVVNLDESFRIFADRNSFPVKGLYTEKEVAQHDKIRAKAAQQQQMAQVAPAAVDAAKSLSQIPMGPGNSALNAVAGNFNPNAAMQGAA